MPVWCRMFQPTLDGPARGWFDRLPNGCINNWTNLREAFVERFALRRKCCKDPMEVAKIVRRANETLPNFKERWTEETSYIPDVPVVMQISTFMSNSKCPELARRFSDQVPQTVAEMMRMVDDFVKSEEVFKNTKLPKWEQPERPALEIALESGKLNHLIKDVRQRGGDKGRQTRSNNGRKKVINMVRQSYNGLKRKSPYKQSEEWMDVPITFPPVSTNDMSDRPLIVEAEVEGYWIRRVFVDQRASVQVMFEHCFDNLSLDIKARLAPTQTELMGFSGKQLIPLGKSN
nr:reverse transcriptase domain-containing protein [Tanacetum cinerariifolium]